MYEPRAVLLKCAKECAKLGFRASFDIPTWDDRNKELMFLIKTPSETKTWFFKNKNKNINKTTKAIYEWIANKNEEEC